MLNTNPASTESADFVPPAIQMDAYTEATRLASSRPTTATVLQQAMAIQNGI
jgi:hypothetical protein